MRGLHPMLLSSPAVSYLTLFRKDRKTFCSAVSESRSSDVINHVGKCERSCSLACSPAKSKSCAYLCGQKNCLTVSDVRSSGCARTAATNDCRPRFRSAMKSRPAIREERKEVRLRVRGTKTKHSAPSDILFYVRSLWSAHSFS